MVVNRVEVRQFISEAEPLIQENWKEAGYDMELEFNPMYEEYITLGDMGALCCYGAYEGDEMVGYFVALVTKHYHTADSLVAKCDTVYIKPEYRGKNRLTELLDGVEQDLYEYGVDRLFICVRTKQKPKGDGLYEKLGYNNEETTYSKKLG